MKLVASLSSWAELVQSSTRNVEPSVSLSGTNSEAELLERARSCYDYALTRLSDPEAPLLNESDAKHLLFRARALKKWKFASHVASIRKNEAFDGFVSRNDAARDRGLGCSAAIRYIMRRLLSEWLPELPPEVIVTGRFGPGACAERLTRLQRFIRLDEWVRQSCHWPEVPVGVPDAEHVTARLCAVPKDWYRDRLITVEPAYGTFVQQYVRSILLESVHAGPLAGGALDQLYVDAPARQRRLALRASQQGGRHLATIDLKDASDSISWDLVRDVMPSWVVRLLEVTRSENFVDPRDPSQRLHKMWIFAGMGNATTFVVESLIFKAYVTAYMIHHGLNRARVDVFGDDVITSTDCAKKMVEEGCDPFFIINKAKSFWGDSPFRESCGIFAYNGMDITVPKVDGYADTWEGRCGLADLFHRAGDFPALQMDLLGLHAIPNWPRVVPGYPATCSALADFDDLPPVRQNRQYQRLEYRLTVRQAQMRRLPLSDVGDSRSLAASWLTATLCGMFGSDDLQGRYALVPTGRYVDHLRWLPTEAWDRRLDVGGSGPRREGSRAAWYEDPSSVWRTRASRWYSNGF